MIITLRKVATGLIFVCTTALFVLFILFDSYTWGKYVLLGLSACILLLGIGITRSKIILKFNPYAALNILFIVFVLLSSMWAIDASDSVIMARTLMRIFVCAYAVYITYLSIPELDETVLLKAVVAGNAKRKKTTSKTQKNSKKIGE